MSQFSSDFSSYANGAIASVSSGAFSVHGTPVNWTHNNVTDAGAVHGKSVEVDNGASGDIFTGLVYETPGSTAGDIELLCIFRITSIADVLLYPIGGALLDTGDSEHYSIRIADATTVQIVKWTAGTGDDFVGSSWSVTTLANGDTLFCRIGRSGTTIRAKLWKDGESEPGSWQGSGTNTALTTVKAAFVSQSFPATPYNVEYMGVGTGGDAAPSPGGGGGAPETQYPGGHAQRNRRHTGRFMRSMSGLLVPRPGILLPA